MAKNKGAGIKRTIPTKNSKTAAKKSGKSLNTKIEVRTDNYSSKIMPDDSLELFNGVPFNRLRSTQQERDWINNTLTKLKKPNMQHFIVDIRLKSTVLRLAEQNFPAYKMSTSTNKDKKTVSIWRSK